MLNQQEIKQCWQQVERCIKATKAELPWLIISISQQTLYLLENKKILCSYPVSTSKQGSGNKQGSYQTPLGVHSIAEKIGGEQPANMIFQARQPTGEIAHINNEKNSHKDLITSRILWLSGEEKGINQGGDVDSYQRYIYIHGTAEEKLIGRPASIGCVRMYNDDIIALFQKLKVSSPVILIE